MSESSQTTNAPGRLMGMFLSCVIGVAVVGYFVGINDGVPLDDGVTMPSNLGDMQPGQLETEASQVSTAIPAVAYSGMRRRKSGPTGKWTSSLSSIPQPEFDLFAEIKPSEEDKQQSTLTRASRRAFNGAPPVIPHLVENTADSACYACHGQGMRIGDRVANQMSHAFLANCTQCHAPPPPKPFSSVDVSVDNSFVGLPAPMKGERAFPGAPPTIPHSTWMRESCLACHGNENGWKGLQSTHPWRVNCQQCHAPSAVLEQAVSSEVQFLKP